MFFRFSMKLTGRKHSSQSPQCNENMLHATALLVVISHLAHDTKMASGAENPRPTSPLHIVSLQDSRSSAQAVTAEAPHSTPADGDHLAIPSSTFSNVFGALLQSPPSCRYLQCCALPFVSLCESRQSTHGQPLHGTMQMSNPTCPSSFHDTLG